MESARVAVTKFAVPPVASSVRAYFCRVVAERTVALAR